MSVRPVPPPGYWADWAAEKIAPQLRPYLRKIEGTTQWLGWNGHRWAERSGPEAMKRAVLKALRRLWDADSSDENPARSDHARRSVTELLSFHPAMLASADDFDAREMELNTPGGIVELTSGELKPSDPESFHSKATAVAPAPPGAVPELWTRFLTEVTNGDEELSRYLQKLAGYCCTGTIREHVLAVVHGPGGNGKSVFLNTLAAILGDYATAAPLTAFVRSRSDSHPTELAGLMGARLVLSTETQAGTVWDEQKIKAVTSGDPMRTRLMRQDFVEVTPRFKLIVSGNHPPQLERVDDAMRRRLAIIPFTFRPEKPDVDLPAKLESEYSEILRWAINGALLWAREGLTPPASVRARTEDFFSDQEPVRTWLDERCELDPAARTARSTLYDDWRLWCDRNGEHPGSSRTFKSLLAPHLDSLPVEDRKIPDGRMGYWGLRLRSTAEVLS